MRLFLASNDLGNYANKLSEMVGDANRKTLVISNARDYKTPEARLESLNHDLALLKDAGLEPIELDLRPFFGKPEELRKYIEEYQPGLVFVMGGNLFLVATALRESGMDDTIRQGLNDDKFVYGGYSAGSMVASKDLKQYLDNYSKDNGRYDESIAIYGKACTDGLGLLDEYVCPHADRDRFAKYCEEAIEKLPARGLTPIKLNDTDVFVIEGKTKKVYEA